MITEDQLEQLAIQWFQDTGWSYVNGKVISPEGGVWRRGAMPGQAVDGALAPLHALDRTRFFWNSFHTFSLS